MYILGDTIWIDLLMLILTLITSVILYYKYCFTYWSKRNVITLSPTIPFGNLGPYVRQKTSLGEHLTHLYNQLKNTGKSYAGFYVFSKPTLLLLDPELCKFIMTKDFTHFMTRNTYTNENEPITEHLVNINGSKWKNMRSKLTPTFTSGKMKMMFQTLVACSKELEIILDRYIKTGASMDVKDTMGRFTTDIIGSCAFGIDCNSLKEPDNVFRKYGRRIFENTKIDALKLVICNHLPKLFVFLGLKKIPLEASTFFTNVVKDTVDFRKKNDVNRKDFMQLLIQLKPQGIIDDEEIKNEAATSLTIDQITAQCFVFFLAGFETSSTAMSSFMYEMAVHQDIQDKVRNEINDVLKRHEGKITYESLMEMTYLEKVIDETMRIHSIVPILQRRCTIDYKLPNSDLLIKEGINVFIPVKGFHDDPKYYPNPQVFDPERFSAEAKAARHPYAFLPFGAGPRNCIGLRFGLMQMKVGLTTLLKNHRFTLNLKTQTPLKQDPKCTLYSIMGGIWVDVERVH